MIYESHLWSDDLDIVVNKIGNDVLEKLSEKTVLITGASGLICSTLADVLIRFNETKNGNIKIVAASRSEENIIKRFGHYSKRDYFRFVSYDATKSIANIGFPVDFIIHGAGNAFPDLVSKQPVETMQGNILGLIGLLEYAKDNNVNRLLYISSSEIYGRIDNHGSYKEGDYGYIDILNVRNSYSVGKRASETMCISFSEEYDMDAVIVRPGHIYGPTASVNDNRVSSQWPYAVSRGNDIIMKSNGEQLRSYCYCLDCASAILTVLLKGKKREAYNISNSNTVISIREMAEILASSAGVKIKMEIPSERERKIFNPMSNSSLDNTKLVDLGWEGCFSHTEGLSHTVQILKDIMK